MADLLKGPRAALFALAIACAVLLLLAATPIYAMFSAQASDTDALLQDLGRTRAELGQRGEFEKQLSQARRAIAAAPGLVSAASAPLAESQIQSEVKSIVEAHGGEVHSTQILPSDKRGNLDVLSIQYNLAVPATQLRDLVYALETHTPYLFVDDADVVMPVAFDPNVKDAPEPKFDIRWTIHAYRWRGTP